MEWVWLIGTRWRHNSSADGVTQTNVVGGHFLTEDIGLFDANFFNLSAETAAVSSATRRSEG